MARVIRRKGDNLYKYFTRNRGYMRKLMDEHRIHKAILEAIGIRQFDDRIRAIWDRVLKKPTSEDIKGTTPNTVSERCNFATEGVNRLHNDRVIYIKKAVVIGLDEL